jgi:hypothetical protein
MTVEAQAPKPDIDPALQKVFDDLEDESTLNYTEDFKSMIHSDTWVYEGETFTFQMQNHKRLGELKKLQKVKIDEEQDWDAHVENVKAKALLLIKEMTPEKFDQIDFISIENLVTAWSARARRGFRRTFKVS